MRYVRPAGRKIVDGMAPGQAALYSASKGVTVLLTTTKSFVQQRFLHFIALYDWKDWSRSRSCGKVSVSGRASALNLEMFCRCFSFVRDFLVFDNLPLIESAEAGFLDSRDMDKHILAAVLRLDKPVPFLRVEPFHGAERHC
jgi:hypothetical protein